VPPTKVIVAAVGFGPGLPASRVAATVAEGVAEGDPRLVAVPVAIGDEEGLAAAVGAVSQARAVLLCDPKLCAALEPTPAFRLGQEARQRGVAAYGITATSRPSPFYARIIDLQQVVVATGEDGLRRAGVALARAAAEGLQFAAELPPGT